MRKPAAIEAKCISGISVALAASTAAALPTVGSAKQSPQFAPHFEYLQAERAGASEAKLAAKYDCDPGYMHRLLTGQRPVARAMAAKIAAANPGVDFTYMPAPQVEATSRDVMAAQRGQATDIDLWVTWAKSERALLLDDAADAIAATTPDLQLRGSAAYVEFVAALGDQAVPAPVTDGPTADLQTCLARLEGLVSEATATRERAVRDLRGDDALKLSHFITSTRGKLKRLGRQTTAGELLAGEPWQAIAAALCDALRFEDDCRTRLADSLEKRNELCRDADRRLRLTRHIVYPTNHFRDDPVGFARIVLGVEFLWPGQIEILEAIRDHRRVTIRSGNKCSKTFTLAIACLWIYATFPNAEVILGAPTVEQLGGTLWKETQRLWGRSGICADCREAGVTQRPCPHSQCLDGKMHNSCHGESGGLRATDGRRIYGRVAADAGGLLGFSGGEGLVIVADESSELDHESFTALEFNAAAIGAKFVMAGNPLRLHNPQWESFNGELAAYWHPVHLSGIDASKYANRISVMSPDEIAMAATLDPVRGTNSDQYRARILGDFPLFDVELSLTDDDLVQAHARWATMATDGPLTISVDPGGEKDRADPFGFCARRGPKIVALFEKRCSISESIFIEVDALILKWGAKTDLPIPIRYDGSSRLGVEFEKELLRYIRANGGDPVVRAQKILPGQNSFKKEFKLWRDWSLDNLVLRLIKDVGLPHCPDLDNQLRLIRSSQKLEDDKSIRSYIPKSQMRTRLHGASPNLLDALAYCLENYDRDTERTPGGRQSILDRDIQRIRDRQSSYQTGRRW